MTVNESYQECLQEMFGLKRFGIKLELSTIRRILRGLGNPQDGFSSIHVAGTNGKGSIAAGITSILMTQGYRVGLYTSPHLVEFNERITVNGEKISNAQVVEAYDAVRKIHSGARQPTFFEFSTAMAFYEFGRRDVQWAVIETGMGGRFDATNVIQPAVGIISNISLEHKFYLGNTLAKIAHEKGGIIKPKTPLVTGVRQKQAADVIHKIADDASAPVFRFGKDFRVRRNRNDLFSYYGMQHNWYNLQTSLLGRHQVDNAALVLAVVEILNTIGTSVSEKSCREGIARIHWPGRLEIIPGAPEILLDGAHNLAAARKLNKFLSSRYHGKPITLVMGVLDDKPYQAMLQLLVPLSRRVILTRPVIDRALPPEILLTEARSLSENISLSPSVDQAVRYALETARYDEIVCIAGSLYVVGEAKETLARIQT